MPAFETFIKPIWDKRDWLQHSAALWQQNFSSSFEMKFPFWQNNHFGNTSCPLLRPSSSLFGTGEIDCNIQLPHGNKIFHQAWRWNFRFDKIIILATHHAHFWGLHHAILGSRELDCNLQLVCGNKRCSQASKWNFFFHKITILATRHGCFWRLCVGQMIAAMSLLQRSREQQSSKKLVKVVKSCNNVLSNWLFCQNGKIIF